jgi:hypothetical protein
MKNLILVFTLLSWLSCTSTTETELLKERIQGRWFLTNQSGTEAGFREDYEKNIITWTFDKKLNITNNVQTSFFEKFEGVKSYTVEIENSGTYLTIDTRKMAIQAKTDTLICTDLCFDCITFTLVR